MLFANARFIQEIQVTTQVPKTTIVELHYAGTTYNSGGTATKPGI